MQHVLRWLLVCSAWATLHLGAATAAATTITELIITNSPATGLVWDTHPGGGVTAFVKDGGSFQNDGAGQISLDISSPGTYTFDLRLNKGTGREMQDYRFRLFFDGEPDNGTPGIDVIAPRDTTGATPPFAGDDTHIAGGNTVLLTLVRVSSFDAVDEVGETSASPDGNIDYVGTFQLTVVPEPAAVTSMVSAGLVALLVRRAFWHRAGRSG